MRKTTARSLAALAALLFLPSTGRAQETGDDFTFFETVDVKVVNIEVVVTGPDGAPVRGLAREDFELFEDGRPVEITNFYSIDAPSPMPLDPAAARSAQSRVEPVDQQLHLAIFVDGMSLQPANRRRMLNAISDFFNYQGARPTSLTLASFDGNLTVESMPRYDPNELARHLDTLKSTAARGALREMDRRSLLRELNNASVTIGQGGSAPDPDASLNEANRMLNAVSLYAERLYAEARLSADALTSVVEALAGLPGRKALLYVSGGLARNPGEAMYYAWEAKFSDFVSALGVNVYTRARELDTTPAINELIRFANANRVTFYSIAAGREGSLSGVTAEDRGFDPSLAGSGGGRNWSASLDALDSSNLNGTLEHLAAATGGLSMTNSRNFGALLNDMNRDLESYYSLGYTPSPESDDRVHKLTARVRGTGLSVRHRESYRAQSVEEVMSGRTRSAALLGTYENPLGVTLEFGAAAPRQQKKKEFLVPVMIKVPLSKLVLVPQEGEHVGRIGIFICTRDGRGRTSPVKAIEVPIRIPRDKLKLALGQMAGYRMMLQMRAEEHAVAVAVRDELGRTDSTVTGRWDPTTPAS